MGSSSDSKILEEAGGNEIDDILSQLVAENEKAAKAVEDIRGGKTKAVGFLVGQVMKRLGGKVNPKEVQEKILNNIK